MEAVRNTQLDAHLGFNLRPTGQFVEESSRDARLTFLICMISYFVQQDIGAWKMEILLDITLA